MKLVASSCVNIQTARMVRMTLLNFKIIEAAAELFSLAIFWKDLLMQESRSVATGVGIGGSAPQFFCFAPNFLLSKKFVLNV